MSVLPRKGEAREAMVVMNARLRAVAGDDAGDSVTLGVAEMDKEGMTGPGAAGGLAIYGDLFDVADTLLHGGAAMLQGHVVEIARGNVDVWSALINVYLQGLGLGVMIERRRWEAERREQAA